MLARTFSKKVVLQLHFYLIIVLIVLSGFNIGKTLAAEHLFNTPTLKYPIFATLLPLHFHYRNTLFLRSNLPFTRPAITVVALLFSAVPPKNHDCNTHERFFIFPRIYSQGKLIYPVRAAIQSEPLHEPYRHIPSSEPLARSVLLFVDYSISI